MCHDHIAYVERTGGRDPEEHNVREVQAWYSEQRAMWRREKKAIRDTPCRECENRRWTPCSRYCKPHAILAKERGEGFDATRLCRAPRCNTQGTVADGLCSADRKRAQKFSLTPDQLLELLGDGTCEACGGDDRVGVDHAHECCPNPGESCGDCIRGVLCTPCNLALGLTRNDPERLRSLAEYLEKESTNSGK